MTLRLKTAGQPGNVAMLRAVVANFRTHTVWGVTTGVATAAASWYAVPYAGLGEIGVSALSLAVLAAFLGSVVPDLDHEAGTGLHEVSALISSVLPVLVVAALKEQDAAWRTWGLLGMLPLHAGLQVLSRRVPYFGERRGVIATLRALVVAALTSGVFLALTGVELLLPEPWPSGQSGLWLAMVGIALLVQLTLPVVKRVTVHRGVLHSIPAVCCFALAAYAYSVGMGPFERALIALSACLGGLSHLILDEIYAVDFDGVALKTRRSFGTALCLWKVKSPLESTLIYVMMLGLAAVIVSQSQS